MHKDDWNKIPTKEDKEKLRIQADEYERRDEDPNNPFTWKTCIRNSIQGKCPCKIMPHCLWKKK